LQIIKRQEKTRRAVHIPLKETAWGIINDRKEDNPTNKVFHCLRILNRRRTSIWLNGLKKRGLKNPWDGTQRGVPSPHGSLNTELILYTVAKLLGHKNIKQVAKYAQATDELRR
jgi:integrase